MAYFNCAQEKVYKKLLIVREMVAEQLLYEEPCPLLYSRLNELKVLTNKLSEYIGELEDLLEE